MADIQWYDHEPRRVEAGKEELEEEGHTVYFYSDSLTPEEVKRLRTEKTGLIISEIIQGVDNSLLDKCVGGLETGLYLLEQAKGEGSANEHTPVLVFTTSDRPEIAKEVERLYGPGSYLYKPVTSNEALAARVEELLRGNG